MSAGNGPDAADAADARPFGAGHSSGIAQPSGGVAVVVGATGAVGGAIAARLRAEGLTVVAVARGADALSKLVTGDPGIVACPADIGIDAAQAAISDAVSELGPVRMVVQSTGLPATGPLQTVDPTALGTVVALKLGGLLRLVRAVDRLLEPGSWIVAIGGHFGSEPVPRTCGAGVTNAALANLIRQLADVYGPRGITVHLVAPGPLDTARLRNICAAAAETRGVSMETVLEEYRAHSPLERVPWIYAEWRGDPEHRIGSREGSARYRCCIGRGGTAAVPRDHDRQEWTPDSAQRGWGSTSGDHGSG